RHAATGDLALEHWQEALGIGRVAGLDDDVEDQAAAAGDQVELVSVPHVTGPLIMMSACGSNRLTSFSPAGTAWPSRTRRWLWARIRSISGRKWPSWVRQRSAAMPARLASLSPASCSAAWVARGAAVSSR